MYRPAVVALALLAACASGADDAAPAGEPAAGQAPGMRLRAGGTAFAAPFFRRLALRTRQRGGATVVFRVMGARAARERVSSGRLDLAIVDLPEPEPALERAGLARFPVLVGAVVPVVHLDGVGPGELRLDADALGGLLSGAIARWDDPALAALNPDLDLPARDVIVVHQAEAAATTWALSAWLARHAEGWAARMGVGERLDWPTGVPAEDDEQLARFVGHFRDTIGYVELSRARDAGLSWVTLLDPAGRAVSPDPGAVAASAEGGRWVAEAGFAFEPAEEAGWPLSLAAYALVPREESRCERAAATLDLLHRALTDGGGVAAQLGYAPIPHALVPRIEASWAAELRCEGRPIWPPAEATPAGAGTAALSEAPSPAKAAAPEPADDAPAEPPEAPSPAKAAAPEPADEVPATPAPTGDAAEPPEPAGPAGPAEPAGER